MTDEKTQPATHDPRPTTHDPFPWKAVRLRGWKCGKSEINDCYTIDSADNMTVCFIPLDGETEAHALANLKLLMSVGPLLDFVRRWRDILDRPMPCGSLDNFVTEADVLLP